ncbi:DUF4198 domain-containing protein [Solirubrum puertoriconensis]|uniref:DUF4198 domain-containing protein n=1 Tax=Solirubrum puertoriconensis TaxID=1751427 RepID=A0A9X0L552_SOLP1|nr:DUF4198 domain-containing protein [Solirubrum puertoriconensis]KUG08297.1 hypothetical protein ASU33_08970 [Solirubrum puertoriconensis]
MLIALGASASEFWLQPVRFVVAPGSCVHLGRWVGQQFRGERWSGNSQRLEELAHLQPGGTRANLTATARQADTLQTSVLLKQPGTHMLGFRTNNATISMTGAEFTDYLRAEGLSDILALRQRRRQTTAPARERYRRCAKTLIQAGRATPTDTTWQRHLGHPLEILLEQNPYTLRPGAALTVVVLAAGRPASNQTVQAWLRPHAGGSTQHFTLHTNNNGRTLLRLLHPADILLSIVRMEPYAAPAEADWQSTWATLTFAFPGDKSPSRIN